MDRVIMEGRMNLRYHVIKQIWRWFDGHLLLDTYFDFLSIKKIFRSQNRRCIMA